MKKVIGRGFFLTFLFITIAALYLYFLIGLPLKESWRAFYELTVSAVPIGWWILNTALLLGWTIAIWTHYLERSKEKVIEDRLSNLIDTEENTYPKEKFSPRMDRTIETVSNLIHYATKKLTANYG